MNPQLSGKAPRLYRTRPRLPSLLPSASEHLNTTSPPNCSTVFHFSTYTCVVLFRLGYSLFSLGNPTVLSPFLSHLQSNYTIPDTLLGCRNMKRNMTSTDWSGWLVWRWEREIFNKSFGSNGFWKRDGSEKYRRFSNCAGLWRLCRSVLRKEKKEVV